MILDKEKTMNAILAINPDAQVSWLGEDTESIVWHDGTTKISDSELQAKITEMDAEYDAQAYSRARASEYPDFREYLDGIVKGDEAQKQKYIDDCLAVKAKYPKN